MIQFLVAFSFVVFALQGHAQVSTTQSVIKGPNYDILKDGQVAKVLITLNDGEIAAAEWAQKRAKNQEVREYATKLKNDHYENSETVKRLAVHINADIKDSDLNKSLNSSAMRAERDLQKVKKGSPDKAYIEQQIKMHELALTTIKSSLIPNASNSDLRAHLEKTREDVQMHLDSAREIQSRIN